jgi:glycine betaine/proline transport system substrate-binding protein
MNAEPVLRVGTIDLSFHHAASGVVQEVLRLAGYRTEQITAPHVDLFASLGSGELDLLVSAWLPGSHGEYLEPFKDEVIKLGALYEPFALWGVPDYVPAELVSSVADLARPEIAHEMVKLIQGIGPGAGISRFSREIVKKYRLDEWGYEFRNGSQAECESAFESAVADRRWVVVPLWEPQHLHHVYRIRALAEPHSLLRGKDAATLLIRKDAAGHLNSVTRTALTRMRLGNTVVTELDHAISRLGRSPVDAAAEWMRHNKDHVDSWYL